MRRLVPVAVLLGFLASCANEEKRAEVVVDLSKKLSPGCYTVDLFDPYIIEYPGSEVPEDYRKFLGVWKNGAWGGLWCHDLYITRVDADGSVELLDAHGPYAAYEAEATVFKRKAQIKDGVLSFMSYGRAPVNYRLVGEYLLGERRDVMGTFEITMSRVETFAEVPIPLRNPKRGCVGRAQDCAAPRTVLTRAPSRRGFSPIPPPRPAIGLRAGVTGVHQAADGPCAPALAMCRRWTST